MNYIINPLWIYLLDVLSDIESILCIVSMLTLIAAIIAAIIFIINCAMDGCDRGDNEYKISKIVTKISTIIAIVTAIIVALIPSQKTMYTMLITSYVTEENIDATGKTVTDMIDYIFEKVDELQDNDESQDD